MREVTLGVLAHVDAGKTTLCEQLLFRGGLLSKIGRVDRGDAFMDADEVERARGITVFCEQATVNMTGAQGECARVTLMDTPGHVDFSGETVRAMSALDAALLVVSCAEGVQSHTVTLFRLLRDRRIPTLLFLNKTDREGADKAAVLDQLLRLLSTDCVSMEQSAGTLTEELAARDEALMEAYLGGHAQQQDYLAGARRAVTALNLYPVLSGSALLGEGIDALEHAIVSLLCTEQASREAQPFSARIYRVRRADGQRLVYAKLTSGAVAVRDEVMTVCGPQKVSALYEAQGTKLLPVRRARAGQCVVIAGLSAKIGETVGAGAAMGRTDFFPVQSVAILPQPPLTHTTLLAHLRELEDEDPLLTLQTRGEELSVGVMGTVQVDVLGSLLAARFGDKVRFAPPKVRYKETLISSTVGVGHYEPLRHYAEVWLRLSPAERGSGVTFEADCPPNTLPINWQRLIEQHVLEREHPGVLTGAPLTDVHVTLLLGRAHIKHTQGGDFREATYRAVRNALMGAKCVLLEPVLRFDLAMPPQSLPGVTGELLRMGAQPDAPCYVGDEVHLSGTCTAAAFWGYPDRFAAATHGHGRLSSRFFGYAPCKKQERVVQESGYSPLSDEQNPPGSVFCSHGAGVYVAWDHVREWAHCDGQWATGASEGA